MDWDTADIKEVVDDEDWQALRKAMLGTWNLWAARNVKWLEVYLDDYMDRRKLRQVHNYLTGSGFRIGVINHPDIDKLLKRVKNLRYI